MDDKNYLVIYPNNDLGSSLILKAFDKLRGSSRFRIAPSLRFEYFLTLLKNADFIIGNSSAGIREAPYYGVPIINIGSRQQNRAVHASIVNVDYDKISIYEALQMEMKKSEGIEDLSFGKGNSAEAFLKVLKDENIWKVNHQKQFRDI